MTDYLEEYLENAGELLRQVRQMERSVPVAPPDGGQAGEKQADTPENGEKAETFDVKHRTMSESGEMVYNLEEDVNRLEEAVFSPEPVPELRKEWPREPVNQIEGRENVRYRADDRAAEPLMGSPEEERQEAARSGRVWEGEEAAEDVSLPLAVQMETLDRRETVLAAAVSRGRVEGQALWNGGAGRGGYPALLSGARELAVPPDLARAAEESWYAGTAAAGPSGGEQRWAEQADRVFRRDSRRYDGGFYLY